MDIWGIRVERECPEVPLLHPSAGGKLVVRSKLVDIGGFFNGS